MCAQDVVGQVKGDTPTAARQHRSTSATAAILPYIRCIISTVKVSGKGARKKPSGGGKGQQVLLLCPEMCLRPAEMHIHIYKMFVCVCMFSV